MQHSNDGIILLNPEALQSPLMQEYLTVEGIDVLDLIESLKDFEFIQRHAHMNKELSSFNFPNVKSQSMTPQQKQKYVKMLEKTVPKLDAKMHDLIIKCPDPAD